MPPIANVKFCPLYRLEWLITKRSFNNHLPQKQIYREICDLLGITTKHLWRVRRAQIGDEGYLSTTDLIKLAQYFGCTLDDLVTASSPNPASPVSSEVGGDFSPSTPSS